MHSQLAKAKTKDEEDIHDRDSLRSLMSLCVCYVNVYVSMFGIFMCMDGWNIEHLAWSLLVWSIEQTRTTMKSNAPGQLAGADLTLIDRVCPPLRFLSMCTVNSQ